MQRTIKMNFPDGFEFPKEYDRKEYKCIECPFCQGDSEGYDWCTFDRSNDASIIFPCPFYGKSENEVIEI